MFNAVAKPFFFFFLKAELRDEDVLRHLLKANPHKSTFANMMLYLRYQVEEFAFKKWGGPEALDAEYQRREEQKRLKKESKFEQKLKELRKKTRAEAYTKRLKEKARGADKIGAHQHEFGQVFTKTVDGETSSFKRCQICNIEVEEMEI